MYPQPKDSLEIFEIAVSKAFIDQVVQGRKIIFSENTDTPFYNDLNIANTLFFVAIDKIDVFHKSKNLKQSGLIDRDYLSDDEVVQLKKDYPDLFLLPYYSFENLLYHPDNLEEYYKGVNKPFNKQSYIKQITGIKIMREIIWRPALFRQEAATRFIRKMKMQKSLKHLRKIIKE
jgi:hypothetical protein